jgi:hypothetical protein
MQIKSESGNQTFMCPQKTFHVWLNSYLLLIIC